MKRLIWIGVRYHVYKSWTSRMNCIICVMEKQLGESIDRMKYLEKFSEKDWHRVTIHSDVVEREKNRLVLSHLDS